MTKSNLLTAAVTILLLSAIIFVLRGIDSGGQTTPTAFGERPVSAEHTASLQRFTLPEMVDRSGRIFRGTVTDVEQGTISVGGGELPAVTYSLRVDQSFKGDFPQKGDVRYVEVTMLGSIKQAGMPDKGPVRMSVLPTPPVLSVGSEYLLMLTPESPVGLTTTIGLGQGSFEIFTQDKVEWAKNEFNNAGLYNGPVRYETLAADIEQEGGE